MADTPQFDRKQYRENIRQKLEGLQWQEQVAFAARCAWRIAPRIVTGWKDAAPCHDWLNQHLPGLQAAVVAAVLNAYENKRLPGTAAADAASYAAYADASSPEAATFANVAAYAAAAATDAVDTIDAVYTIVRQLSLLKDQIGSDDMERALNIDLHALIDGAGVQRLLNQPLWPEEPPSLHALWNQWREVSDSVPAAGEFWELMLGIHRGSPDWERLRRTFDRWWAQHPRNPELQSNEQSAAPQKKSAKAARPKSTLAAKETSSQETPPEPQLRRIIQQRLVSTTSVTADGEAEKLTPTAQRCMLALREFLVSDETRPPLTVAVEAPWGGGKSSLMRHLQDALTNDVDATTKQRSFKEEPFPTVWFNPWKHEAGKTLWAAFAVAFERQMAESCSRWERNKKRTRLAWQRLEMIEKVQLVLRLAFWIVAFIILACLAWQQTHAATVADWKDRIMQHAPWLGMIVTVWAFLKDAVKQLGSPLKLDVSRLLSHNDHADKVDDLHRFHEDFRRLMHAYIPKRKNGKPGKAVVFIDDLDRCEAPKAAELLQSLHQMLNVQERNRSADDKDAPGIICVLGMDREKVAAAVAAKHEKLLPLLMKTDTNGKVSRENSMIFGHEFLEKFIQLTLHLPPMQGKDLEEFLTSIAGAREITPRNEAVPTPAPVALTPAIGKTPPVASNPLIQSVLKSREQVAAEARIERVNEDLDDGRLALQCARYVAPALENNPRKLKQFVNLFRLRLYLTAAMNFLDLPGRDAEKLDVDPLRRMAPGKLSVHHLAKLVALELAAPSEMAAIRETRPERMFEALEAAFPANEKPLLNALVASRDVFDPEGYDLGSAALDAYFHFFRAEVVKEQPVAE